MIGERLRGCLGKRAAGADCGDASIGLYDISLAAQKEGGFFVGNQQQGFEMAQEFIGAPVFGEFDGGAAQIAVILLKFRLETAEEGEGVGGGTGESSENFVLIEAANFLGSVLDYGFAERDLAVASHDNLVVAADAEDGG